MSEPAGPPGVPTGGRRDLRSVLWLAVPFVASALIFGVSFGILARAAGCGVLAPIVMSATTFAGSAQFAPVSVLGDGGAPVTQVVGGDHRWVFDARLVGLGAAAVALRLRAPILLTVVVAAAATAIVRLVC